MARLLAMVCLCSMSSGLMDDLIQKRRGSEPGDFSALHQRGLAIKISEDGGVGVLQQASPSMVDRTLSLCLSGCVARYLSTLVPPSTSP